MGRLRDLNIKSNSSFYRDFLRIYRDSWTTFNGPRSVASLHNKVRGLTNNPQEGFNSKLNSLIKAYSRVSTVITLSFKEEGEGPEGLLDQ